MTNKITTQQKIADLKKYSSSTGLWVWTRSIFYFFITMWFLSGYIFQGEDMFIWFITTMLAATTFVLSIIHLVKYKSKAFAITALVLSSIWLALCILGFIAGAIIGIVEATA